MTAFFFQDHCSVQFLSIVCTMRSCLAKFDLSLRLRHFETVTLSKEKGNPSHFLVSSVLQTFLGRACERFLRDARLKKATVKF